MDNEEVEKIKKLNYYMSLSYTVIINEVKEENKTYYYGKIEELDGCHITADTIEEVEKELEEVKKAHIEIKLEHGDPIPEPKQAKEKKQSLKDILANKRINSNEA